MTSLLALIPWPWRVGIAAALLCVVGGAYGLGAWRGHTAGYEAADNKGKAALAELRSAHDKAYAEEMGRLRERLEKQTTAALRISDTLEKERKGHAEKEKAMLGRIAAVTRDSRHVFSPEFVRLWNEAVGAVAGGDAADKAGNPAATTGKAGTGKAAGAGVLSGAVAEADILAYVVYYGKRTQDLEAQLNALITLLGDLQQ